MAQLESAFDMVKKQLESERAEMNKQFERKEAELRKAVEAERERMHSEWSWVMNVSGSKGNAAKSDETSDDEFAKSDEMGDDNEAVSEPSMERVVTLDVGGKRFKTTRDTLTKVPGSMLEAMFSGRHPLRPEKNGSFFIDNDGTHFDEILNYLRHGAVHVRDDKVLKLKLASDAKFYGIDSLHKMLDPPVSVLTATSWTAAANIGGYQYIRILTWKSKTTHASIKIDGDKKGIELMQDGDFEVKLEISLQLGYGQGHSNMQNGTSPTVDILLDGESIGEQRLKGDDSHQSSTGFPEPPEEIVIECKISQGRVGQTITVQFASNIQNHYSNQQAQQTTIQTNAVKELTVTNLL